MNSKIITYLIKVTFKKIYVWKNGLGSLNKLLISSVRGYRWASSAENIHSIIDYTTGMTTSWTRCHTMNARTNFPFRCIFYINKKRILIYNFQIIEENFAVTYVKFIQFIKMLITIFFKSIHNRI